MYRLRFLATLIGCFLRPTLGLLDDFFVSFWAIPFVDTDVKRLFTQTYSMYMGVCRWHFVFHSHFRGAALRKGWAPVTTAETIEFRRSIKWFSRVTVRTRLLCWDEKRFFLEQAFLVRGEVHAFCVLEGLIRGPKGALKPPDVFRELGVPQASPPFPARVSKWLESRAAAG